MSEIRLRPASPADAAAIAFYEALGGRRAGRFTDPGPLWRSDNIVFVWDELADLM
ncbi:hypothetical protein [Phenylobacterium sp.]|uniref:hypothetical protein n=1 Tax=Phenylobacterium sp. TaxID=1871053 RepID=UPI002897550A|nr:hypothetical protein [Phenylobacterium sp.]